MRNAITMGSLVVVLVGLPLVLVGFNIYNLCAKNPKMPKLIAGVSLLVGSFFYFGLRVMCFDGDYDWMVAIPAASEHRILSSQYDWSIYLLFIIGIIGLLILLYAEASNLPPLISATAIAMVIVLNITQIAYAIQIARNFENIEYMFWVYHLNLIILSAYGIKKHIKEQVEVTRIEMGLDGYAAEKMDGYVENSDGYTEEITNGQAGLETAGQTSSENIQPQNKQSQNQSGSRFYNWLYLKMCTVSGYSGVVFVVFLVLIAILEIIFVFVGQGMDVPIKAFTDTADWSFSKQTPPPPVEYDGHYLCTVAAGGHKKVVKPLRLGTRRGDTIVVNRQLCIANAFEDYIQEKLPGFHRVIRGLYDRYGYPVSKHITTPLRADVVYFVMKPLEWIFLVFLYMFDVRPEKRINRMYLYQGRGT